MLELAEQKNVDAIEGESDKDSTKADDDEEEPAEGEQRRVSEHGRTWVRVLISVATYMTVRGPITISRGLYREAGVRNGPTRCLYEERRGMDRSGYDPILAELVTEAIARMPSEAASAMLSKALGFRLAPSTMKKVTTRIGTDLRALQAELFALSLARDEIPAVARTLVISTDGLHVPIRKEGFKQAMVATISLLDAAGDRLQTRYIGEMPEAGKATIMARIKQEASAILRARPDLVSEVVIDGARDLRDDLLRLFPDALHVTDFFHVAEHLADALGHLFPADEERRQQERVRWCDALKHETGAVRELHAWLWAQAKEPANGCSNWRRTEVEKHAEYLWGQQDFIQYVAAANDNMALGSGVVEAGGKVLFAQRLKVSGALWSRHGGAAITYIRELVMSGRLDRAMEHLRFVRADARRDHAA
jgi:hypothetical protein